MRFQIMVPYQHKGILTKDKEVQEIIHGAQVEKPLCRLPIEKWSK